MSVLTPNELRQKYLRFFAERGHQIVPSSSLVPENDPTTLFTGSGMQPMMPYLLGAAHPAGQRLVDSQKCFRSQDIEEVGDNRHTTFFEMLGNWSLGDYFKKEQLEWFFAFLTKEVGLDPNNIYVSVFRGIPELEIPRDDEAMRIWQQLFSSVGIDAQAVDFSERDGMQGGRIFYYNEKKNWWSRVGAPSAMPIGEPGGPDSEVFYDFGAERQLHEHSAWKHLPCHVNCDCGRFLEIGNNVFMTYLKTATGFELLKQKNIDFGGGFERLYAAMLDTPDVFQTPLFIPLLERIERATSKKYNQSPQIQSAMRVIADHLRAATFLIVDGVLPSNKGQGYLLRRLLRRAGLKVHQLGGNFVEVLPGLTETVLDMYNGIHTIAVAKQKDFVADVVFTEVQKFQKTLQAGLKILEQTTDVTGKTAFDLYQSYGFPLELTTELVEQQGKKLDKATFEQEFAHHREQSRTASAGAFKGGLADHSEATTKYHTATHLLHAALRKQLGTHVQQKGSNITGDRMRFDFSHPAALTADEVAAVEQQINDWIDADLPVTMKAMKKDAALRSGAIAFFIEKYPDEVTVYTIGKNPEQGVQPGEGWVSKELCGGPHVKHTGEIGRVKIIKEQSASAGVRRIYLVVEKSV